MHLSPEQLVQQIHDSRTRLVLAATGGGSRAISDLLEVPGGSRTFLEAVVPYSAPAMIAWLGGMPDEFCSDATARAMAMAAFLRARRFEDVGALSAGVACTASLATDRPKLGPHRIHAALQTVAATTVWWLPLHKDRRTRAEEERLAGRLLLNLVAEACDVPQRLSLDLLEGEVLKQSRTEAPQAWQDLLLGIIQSVCIGPDVGQPKLLLSGAFNPIHAGHQGMARVAQEILQSPTAFEMSILNVDKPPLDYMEIERRFSQFPAEQTVYLTRAATFEEKSQLFPGATFLVGADTIRRIASPRYYGDNSSVCERAIDRIAGQGCRFLVFGRELSGGFLRLGDLNLPKVLCSLCREVPPEVFREDVSSTGIRRSGMK